jgi:methionyl aminopeptidase
MTVRSDGELAGLKTIGHLAAEARDLMSSSVRVGMTTSELDDIGANFLRQHGATSAPQSVYKFPGFNCISLNEEIVHGIPSKRAIAPGNMVKIDVTAELDGYIGDTATTVLMPPEKEEGRRLLECAKAAFERAIRVIKSGVKVSEIGRNVHQETRSRGFSVVRELSGHGVGRTIHEPPQVPNYYDPLQRAVLTDGLVLAVEPILWARPARAVQLEDGWTISTSNRCLAVHYEHTIVVTKSAPIILTAA